jgi:hypothetical protein
MTREAHRATCENVDLVVYDLEHYGAYLAYDWVELQPCPKDLDKSWLITEAVQRIPGDYIMAWNRLCIEMLNHDPRAVQHLTGARKMPQGTPTLEVSANPYRNMKTGELRMFVEPQFLSAGHVGQRSLDEKLPPIDLITGEVMKDWWNDWHPYGRFHSHNTMGCNPSSTDDASELTMPGMCCIFGSYTKDETWPDGYKFKCGTSVVTPNPDKPGKNMRRWKVAYTGADGEMHTRNLEPTDIFEWDPASEATFHPNVWTNIMYEEPQAWGGKPKSQMVQLPSQRGVVTHTSGWNESTKIGGGAYRQYTDELEAAFKYTYFKDDKKSDIRWRMRAILNMLREMEDAAGDDLLDCRHVISTALGAVHGMDVTWYDEPNLTGHEDPEVISFDDEIEALQAERDAIKDFTRDYPVD